MTANDSSPTQNNVVLDQKKHILSNNPLLFFWFVVFAFFSPLIWKSTSFIVQLQWIWILFLQLQSSSSLDLFIAFLYFVPSEHSQLLQCDLLCTVRCISILLWSNPDFLKCVAVVNVWTHTGNQAEPCQLTSVFPFFLSFVLCLSLLHCCYLFWCLTSLTEANIGTATGTLKS